MRGCRHEQADRGQGDRDHYHEPVTDADHLKAPRSVGKVDQATPGAQQATQQTKDDHNDDYRDNHPNDDLDDLNDDTGQVLREVRKEQFYEGPKTNHDDDENADLFPERQ